MLDCRQVFQPDPERDRRDDFQELPVLTQEKQMTCSRQVWLTGTAEPYLKTILRCSFIYNTLKCDGLTTIKIVCISRFEMLPKQPLKFNCKTCSTHSCRFIFGAQTKFSDYVFINRKTLGLMPNIYISDFSNQSIT